MRWSYREFGAQLLGIQPTYLHMVVVRQRIEDSDLEVMLRERLGGDRLRIPPYPAIALRLQHLVREAKHTARDVCAIVGADAALVAAVLRRANAATYGTTAPVHTLEAAVKRIGIDDLLQLALAQSVGVMATRPGPLSSLRRGYWRSSLVTSRLASELAPRRAVVANQAFLAGLLHDFGAIAVLAGLEDLDVELPVLPADVWKALVDRLHVPFGTTIAARWNLPVEIAHAIAHHHEASHYDGEHRILVDLVATVDHVNDIFERAPGAGVAALLAVPGLSQDERYRIGIMLPQIMEIVTAFETASSPVVEARAPTVVARSPIALDGGWPVRFVVESNKQSFEAYAIDHHSIAFRGGTALLPNWIAPLVLCTDPKVDMFANVTACEPLPGGGFAMVAQPYGMGGECKQQWMALLQRTRRSVA